MDNMLDRKGSFKFDRPRRKMIPCYIYLRINIPRLLGPRVALPHRARDGNTTSSGPHVDGLRALVDLGVNTDLDRSIETLLHGLAEKDSLECRVITLTIAGLEEHISGILGPGLVVCAVWAGLLDAVEEALLDVELTNVGDSTTADGVVRQQLSTVVDDG